MSSLVPMSQLKLFGYPRLMQNDVDQAQLRSRKALALLGYLAQVGKPVSRQKLAFLLWPDKPEAKSRNNLSGELSKLTRMLPENIVADYHTVALQQTSDLTVDCWQLSAVIQEVDTWPNLLAAASAYLGRESPTAAVSRQNGYRAWIEGENPARLATAAQLYTAEFMAGVSLKNCPEFELWLMQERETWQQQLNEVWQRLAAYYLLIGNIEQALVYFDQWLMQEPWQEDGHRLLMVLYARQGHKHKALDQYRQLQGILGVEPTAATANIFRAVQEDEITQWRYWATDPLEQTIPTVFPPSPYQGLDPFTEEEEALFFGRTQLVSHLVAQVQARPFVAVIGASGSGKSSVVYAGVIPKIRSETKWLIADFRPGSEPLAALADSLVMLLEQTADVEVEQAAALKQLHDALPTEAAPFHEYSQNPLASPLLLVIDQFEELYTEVETSGRERLIDLLLTAVSAKVRVIITMRADFMGQALQYQPLAETLRSSTELMGGMSRAELREVITAPAVQQTVTFEAGLVERILDDVSLEAEPLPLLEFALTLLWQTESENTPLAMMLSHRSYEQIGALSGAITQYADAVYQTLPSNKQQLAQRLFLQLIRPGKNTFDTRRIAKQQEVGEAGWQMAQYLADHRLVVLRGADKKPDQNTAEIAHEALIRSWSQLKTWADQYRTFRLWQERLRQFVTHWTEASQPPEMLLHGALLTEAENWLQTWPYLLSDSERDFIQQSSAKQAALEVAEKRRQEAELAQVQALAAAEQERAELEEQSNKRLRRLVVGLVLFFIAAVGLAGIAIQQWQQSRAAGERLQMLNLASAAQLALRDGDTEIALSLAIEANSFDDPPTHVKNVLVDAAYAPGTVRLFEGHTAPINDIALSPDEQLVLSASAAGRLLLFDIATGEMLHRFEPEGENNPAINTVAFNQAGQSFFSGDDAGQIIEWSVVDYDVIQRFAAEIETASPVTTMAVHANGQWLLTGSAAGQLRLWDIASGELVKHYLTEHEAGITALSFTPDGESFLAGDADGKIYEWRVIDDEPRGRFDAHAQAINQITLTADGQRVISSANDLLYWERSTGTILKQISVSLSVLSFVLDPDEETLSLGLATGLIEQWDLVENKLVGQLIGHEGEIGSLMGVDGGERYLLSAATDGQLRLWDLWNGAEIERYEYADLSGLMSLDLTADESTAIIGTADGMLITQRLWVKQTARHLSLTSDWLWGGTHVLPDSATAVVASGSFFTPPSGQSLHLVDLANNQQLTLWPFTKGITRLAVDSQGEQVLFVAVDGTVWLGSVTGSRELQQLAADVATPAHGVAITPDDQTALVSFVDGYVYHIDLATGEEIGRFRGSDAPVRALAVLPDGKTVLAGSFDHTIYHWDLTAHTLLNTLVGHGEFTSQIRVADDGRFALSTSVDKTMILWDLAEGSILRQYRAFEGSPLDVRLSDDLKTAYTVEDRDAAMLRVWRLDYADEELLKWIEDYRYVPDLTCEQRVTYHLLLDCS